MKKPAFLPMPGRALLALCIAPLLVACENSATAYSIDGNRHALILVREQPYFWDASVNQAVVASRLPQCQRRVEIHPDDADLTEMEVFAAGDLLWALHQGEHWYLASTERCAVQDWDAPVQPPGPLIGTFRLTGGGPAFVPVGE